MSRLPGLGLLVILVYAHSVVAQQVKMVTVESQLMRFPGISIDGVDYSALLFEYAHQGQAEIVASELRVESLSCADEPVVREHLSIAYRGPEVIFRISDQRNDRVLLLRQLDTSGTVEYGVGNCNATDVEAEFNAQKQPWLKVLTEELLVSARDEMQQYVQTEVALAYESLMFPLFYIASDGGAFYEVNQAFDLARMAFDLNLEFGATVEAEQQLSAAAGVWESKLKDLPSPRNSEAAGLAVHQALHRNLSAVYLFLGNFEQARRNDALAIARGMNAEESLQDLISAHERRYVLSPQVAGNIVLKVNLYRYGQNAMADAQISHSSRFSSFKQALGQN